jgi:beta-mannosidase
VAGQGGELTSLPLVPDTLPGPAQAALGAGVIVTTSDTGAVPMHALWELCETRSGACTHPDALDPAAVWWPATVPGTVAQALRDAGRFDPASPESLSGSDWWYRARFSGRGRRTLRFEGLASVAQVWLNGALLFESHNMFTAHEVTVELVGDNVLHLCFRALHAALAGRRGRMRWRVKLISPATLRFARTTALGRMPGWCPSIEPVGPWRPVGWVDDAPLSAERIDVAPRIEGNDGVVAVRLVLRGTGRSGTAAILCSGEHCAPMVWRDARTLEGELRIVDVERWWPHTHGRPALYPLAVRIAGSTLGLRRIGFRTVDVDRGAHGRGFAIRINGVPVFCRGACWTSADLVTLPGNREAYLGWLARAVSAGMNMLRIAGTMTYESDAFYDLCDEMGLMVWQDFMFANFDYPAGDPAFVAEVEREVTQLLHRTAHHPALVVLCGGSEVAQQAAMLGLPETARRLPLFDERLAALAADLRPDAIYVPNSPSGGELPFQSDEGVAHYYGVGAYQRPLTDARLAQVRFASECLALANVPEADSPAMPDVPAVHHPAWKQAVPRDPQASWDFDDVRDFYVRELFGLDPQRLRYENPSRYLDVSRAVSAELAQAVFGEWRRVGSTCQGGLVWQFQDVRPGAGWGLVDAAGRPKAGLYGAAQVWRSVQMLITDEGLNGLHLHLINETPRPRQVRVELAAYGRGAALVHGATSMALPARDAIRLTGTAVIGHFFDFTYAYRFGPRAHDVTVATLTDAVSGEMLGEAFHLPDRSLSAQAEADVRVALQHDGENWWLHLESERFARYIHINDSNYEPDDNWFHLAPGRLRKIALRPRGAATGAPEGEVAALNDPAVHKYGEQ